MFAFLAVALVACSPMGSQAAGSAPDAGALSALHILYFTTRTDAEQTLLSPGSLHAALGAQAVGEWGDLLVLHAGHPAQAILIDGAALNAVHAEDLAALYRQCVVLAFFNVYAPEVAQLVNDPSVASEGWMDGSQPYPSDFYIIIQRTVSGSLGDCSDADPSGPIGSEGGMGKSRSQGELASPTDLEAFKQVLEGKLVQP